MNEQVPCQACNGAGHTVEYVQTENSGPQPVQVTCNQCAGTGRA